MKKHQHEFRKLMGRFVTGVTVIATKNTNGEVIGMTANAITAVSLNPILLLVCIRNESYLLPHLLEKEHFSVNLLHANQCEISRCYGGQQFESNGAKWAMSVNDTPQLIGANASFLCSIYSHYLAGDHTVVFGKVYDMFAQPEPKPALVYAAGQYHELELST